MNQKHDPSNGKIKTHYIFIFYEEKIFFSQQDSKKQCLYCMYSTHHCVVQVYRVIQNISVEQVLITVLVQQSIKQ